MIRLRTQSPSRNLILQRILFIFSALFMMAYGGNSLAASKQVLVLHDSSGPYGYLGKEYAIMLRNLLGHFDAGITILPVKSYIQGMVDQHDATFYLGSTYDEASYLPSGTQEQINYDAFIHDAATTSRSVAWINYNLFKVAWEWNPAWGANTFYEKMGYWFYGTKNNNYNRIKYKNIELNKGVISWVNPGANLTGCFAEGGKAYACAPELNAIVVTDPNKVEIKATAYSTLNLGAAEEPYISRSGNFWYIGDMPFSYFSEEDRYLAFTDILHDIVGSGITQQPLQAIVRFEDVSAGVDTTSLESVMSYLEQEDIPFAVAAIPVYKDPKGVQSEGKSTAIRMANSAVANTILPYYKKGLVSMIAHGYTHQSGNLDNPYNALSGDDFEFYRVTLNSDYSLNFLGGVPGDSREWAKDRMTKARQELDSAQFKAFAWEAPHYFATEADYLGIKDIYSTHYGRMVYTNNEGPTGRYIGQFYPYVIKSDYYGYRQIPENLGNIEPTPFLGYRPLLPADLIRHAKKIRVVRDSIASFFYHPYLGTEYLQDVVQGLKGLGYQFIAPCSLGEGDNACQITNNNERANDNTPYYCDYDWGTWDAQGNWDKWDYSLINHRVISRSTSGSVSSYHSNFYGTTPRNESPDRNSPQELPKNPQQPSATTTTTTTTSGGGSMSNWWLLMALPLARRKYLHQKIR